MGSILSIHHQDYIYKTKDEFKINHEKVNSISFVLELPHFGATGDIWSCELRVYQKRSSEIKMHQIESLYHYQIKYFNIYSF